MHDLVSAAQNNDIEGLRCALAKEVANNEEIFRGRWPYTEALEDAAVAAAQHDHPEALDMILDSGLCMSPDIFEALFEGRSRNCIDALIARGYDVDNREGRHGPFIAYAVGRGDQKMLSFLLSRGADIHWRDGAKNLLDTAAYAGNIPMMKFLLESGVELHHTGALCRAAWRGYTDVMSFVLDRGASIDALDLKDSSDVQRDHFGIGNALDGAARHDQSEAVRLLLERGADPDVTNTIGKTPLDNARTEGSDECVKILEEYMAQRSGPVSSLSD